MTRDLPVDRERLRRQFPALTDGDLDAYETLTRRILERKGPAERGKLTRAIMEAGRAARARVASGGTLTDEDRLAVRYLDAIDKMQGRTSGPSGPARSG